MALKSLKEVEKKKRQFIDGAKTEITGKEELKRKKKSSKKGKIDVFSKQTVNLDKSRHLKVKRHCAENKTSFQDFVIDLIDGFFNTGGVNQVDIDTRETR